MIKRPLWENRIRAAWAKAPIVWLAGVRRVGKTTIAHGLPDTLYLNCDLPSVMDRLADPESFFNAAARKYIILDEVHQLPDPSRVLKIAADAFPKLRILATGASTLAASRKFRDSLTGRKRIIHLLPVLFEELPAFGIADLRERLLRGGLPQVLLDGDRDSEFYNEWLDSFYARDVQELFRVEKRAGFLKLLELLLRQSGSLFESTNLAKLSGITRPTVVNYLAVLEATYAVTILRPYAGGARREIVAQPKVYGFDTGFVAHNLGWTELRSNDCGILWEHLVLETLLSIGNGAGIHFWRDKQQREVDFVIPRGRTICDAIECKWNSDALDTRGLKAFRANYPKGRNYFVAPRVAQPYLRKVDTLEVTFANPAHLRDLLTNRDESG